MRAVGPMTLPRRKAPLWLGILTLLLTALPSFPAQGPLKVLKLSRELEEKVHDTLRDGGPGDLVSVIVRTSGDPNGAQLGRLRGHGGALKARHTTLHGYSARVPASQIEALADDPEVEHVSFDSPVKANLDIAYRVVRADKALADFGALDGRGIGVAIVDSGVANHQDLSRPLLTPQTLEVEIVNHEAGLRDYYGHGTHVAGIVGGTGAASSGLLSFAFRTFKGIAPASRIISIRALAADGSGYTSDIISGIDWAVQNKSTYNIR